MLARRQRYFAFDDYFSFMGLATSGHLATAAKIPHFRFRTLEVSQNRAHRYFGEHRRAGARYAWEQLEDGVESAPGGFWLEHIFHMAHVALSCWNHYQFSGDREYLRQEGYPVIAECARFYQSQHIYRIAPERYIVGKCTDLERLGAGRENAFMTTCGVIATFEAAAEAAERLATDGDEARQWRFLAAKLRESLPVEGEKYVPYPGCEQKSIAVFAGLFPYPVLSPDDSRQAAAIADYLREETTYGNMYPVGNSVCSWYAGWKGLAFARLGDLPHTLACIAQAVGEANDFSEIFEISQPAHHPWFTTAEGSYIQMVNESLLQSTEREVRIVAQGMRDCAFKLAGRGGVMVEAEVENGSLVKLALQARAAYSGRVVCGERVFEVGLKAGELKTLI